MRHGLVWFALAFAMPAGWAGADEEWPAWHPLREARTVEPRQEPATTMSERTYRQLARVHEQLGDGALDDALAGLQRIGTSNLAPYERAQVHQTFGFIHAQQGRDDDALAAFERCIALDALPTFAQQGVVFSVARYYAGQERYAESTQTAMRWFRFAPDPGADAYMLVGVNHVQQGALVAGLPYVRRANALATPREAWKRVELAILVETGQRDAAIALAEEIVNLWPGKARHYETLAGLLLDAGQDARALAALTVPWLAGLFEEERQIVTLARLNLHLNNPARGAAVLATALDDARVTPTVANLELLLNAWVAARETAAAAAVTDQLADAATHGEYHLRRALLQSEAGDWPGVAASAQEALAKGGLARPGEAWVLRGVALAEQARFPAALEAFEGAVRAGPEATRRNAAAWMGYVRTRAAETGQ